MYKKHEASQLRQEFWTAFGQYMAPVTSAEGQKINWVNYKTGKKYIHLRMHADQKHAYIALELSHPALDVQQQYFEHLQQLQTLFNATAGEGWQWQLHTSTPDGKTVSRLYAGLQHINLFNREHWPQLISFFKTRLLALDAFWSMVKDSLDLNHD